MVYIKKKNNDTSKQINVRDKWYNNVKYTFTVNPNDACQFFGKSRRSFRVQEAVISLIDNLKKYATYTLYPEYSQPECRTAKYAGPRMHYHGTITFHDLFGFLELGYYKLARWCMFEIDSIQDESIWETYIKKQQDIWNMKYVITDKTEEFVKDSLSKTKKTILSYYVDKSNEDPLRHGLKISDDET